MMTTMAAMLGGVPLMLGTGTGSEIRQPLGYAMVGGLLVSQALTLFTTPVVYLYLDNLSNALSRWSQQRQAYPGVRATCPAKTCRGIKPRRNKLSGLAEQAFGPRGLPLRGPGLFWPARAAPHPSRSEHG